MANFCANAVRITGSKENILRFVNEAVIKGDHQEAWIRLDKILPDGVSLADEDVCPKHFGFGASPDDPKYLIEDFEENIFEDTQMGEVVMDFDSKWEPPIPMLETISSKYGLEIEDHYYEEGAGFRGVWSSAKGDFREQCPDNLTDDERLDWFCP